MRQLVLGAVGLLATMLYNAANTENLVPEPETQEQQQTELPSFFGVFNPQSAHEITNEAKQIQVEVAQVAESTPKLGAASDQLMQSIGALSRQIGEIHGSLVSRDEIENLIETKTQHYVTAHAMSEALAETKDQLKSASAFDSESSEKFDTLIKRIEALEGKVKSLEAGSLATAKATTQTAQPYGSYGTSSTAGRVASGGGCTGSVAYRVQSTYCEPVITSVTVSDPVITSSYAVATPSVPVASGGCTGTAMTPQPLFAEPAAVHSAVVSLPNESERVKFVQPREPRRVTFADVPDSTTSVQFQTAAPSAEYCTGPDCQKQSAASVQTRSRPGLLGRLRGQ